MTCPKCGIEIPEGVKKCPGCSSKIKAPSSGPKRPKLWISLLSLALAVVMLLTTTTFSLMTKAHSDVKASDAVTNGKTATKTSSEPRYELDKIEKPDSDASSLDALDSDERAAKERADEILVVERAIDEALSEITVEYPEVTIDTVDEYISTVGSAMRDLYYDDVIEDYETNSECVVVDLNAGGSYVYAPAIESYNAGVPDLKVASVQPAVGHGQYDGIEKYESYTDDAAKLIASTFPLYSFSNADDYDDSEVDLDALLKLSEYNVILWDGHGCYTHDYGPLMSLRLPRTEENDAAFSTLINDREILYTSTAYLVSAKFIEKRFADNAFDNTVIYIGTCSGGKTNLLANAFLNKGAEAVYAADNTVLTSYNAKMTYSIAEGLCKQHDDGSYYNVEEALEYAKNINGDDDGSKNRTEIVLFSNNKGFTLDWYTDYIVSERDVVLVLDISGSMSGDPLNETKAAAVEFINTVLDEDARIGVVAYDDVAVKVSDFSTKKQYLTESVNRLYTGGTTNIDAALQLAEEMLDSSKANKKIIVLMSDGVPNEQRTGDDLVAYADTLKDKDFYIYTLGFFHDLYGGEKTEAQSLMDRLASEGHHYEVDDADSLVFFFSDMADTISGQKYIYIEIACPVNVKVTRKGETLSSDMDSLSTRTSFGTLSFEENLDENGEPVYSDDEEYDDDDEDEDTSSKKKIDNRKKILRLKDGMEYDVEIEGTDEGTMNYTVQYMDENGDYTDKREFRNIDVNEDMKATTVASSTRETTVLSVDEDGDGNYDIVYEAKANEKADIVENTTLIILLWLVAIAFIWMAGSLIALVIQLLRRQKFNKLATA